MKTVALTPAPGAAAVALPALGLGTWRMGEIPSRRAAEVAAVRRALELGYRLIDTAEMYGEGGAEEVVGQALAESIAAGVVRRDDVLVVSKVYPHNASARGVQQACDRSRARLQLDTIDLYLLHWRGSAPLAQTLEGFATLVERGHVRRWGVSNFDVADLEDLWRLPGGAQCATNQVWYSASQRGIEFDLLPQQRERALPAMAYSPIDQGTLSANARLAAIGKPHGLSAAQIALAWVMRNGDVVAIPKAVREAHLRDNLAAADATLSSLDLAAIDGLFPPPRRRRTLAMN